MSLRCLDGDYWVQLHLRGHLFSWYERDRQEIAEAITRHRQPDVYWESHGLWGDVQGKVVCIADWLGVCRPTIFVSCPRHVGSVSGCRHMPPASYADTVAIKGRCPEWPSGIKIEALRHLKREKRFSMDVQGFFDGILLGALLELPTRQRFDLWWPEIVVRERVPYPSNRSEDEMRHLVEEYETQRAATDGPTTYQASSRSQPRGRSASDSVPSLLVEETSDSAAEATPSESMPDVPIAEDLRNLYLALLDQVAAEQTALRSSFEQLGQENIRLVRRVEEVAAENNGLRSGLQSTADPGRQEAQVRLATVHGIASSALEAQGNGDEVRRLADFMEVIRDATAQRASLTQRAARQQRNGEWDFRA